MERIPNRSRSDCYLDFFAGGIGRQNFCPEIPDITVANASFVFDLGEAILDFTVASDKNRAIRFNIVEPPPEWRRPSRIPFRAERLSCV